MTQRTFSLNYNVTGAERKRLVKSICEYLNTVSSYCGAPTFAYEVDYFRIDRNGSVSFDDRADSKEVEGLIEYLASKGFVAQNPAQEADGAEPGNHTQEAREADTAPTEAQEGGLCISVPMEGFDADSLDRLRKLVDSKAGLIKKAVGAERLTIQTDESKVSFPWWDGLPQPDEVQAYTAFIAAVCKMAKESKRVNAREKDVESEKYAFRSFLLRLGFIGKECKDQRKLLLRPLSGSAAFPNKDKADAFNAAQKAKREVTRATTDTSEEVETV